MQRKLKILGILDTESGSRYHRVRIPLEGLSGKEVKISDEITVIEPSFVTLDRGKVLLTEDMFKNHDVIYSTWIVQNPVYEIDLWKNKHSCKFIQDYDDCLPSKDRFDYNDTLIEWIRKWIVQSTITADCIVVSSPLLAGELLKLTPNIHISYNFLPNSGQFSIKEKTFNVDRKLLVGIAGSYSHLKDYLEIFNAIKKISTDSGMKNRIKWVVYGKEDDVVWKKVISMFRSGQVEVEVRDFKPLDDYMGIYEDLDVVLAPLQNTVFNEVKSALKIEEASKKGCVVIGSPLYSNKELKGLIVANTPREYYNAVKYLTLGNNFNEISKKLSEGNRKDSKYEERVEKLRELIEVIHNPEFIEENKVFDDKLKVFSIIYDKDQYGEYETYDNSNIRTVAQKSYLMEYNPIIDILSHKVDNYEGYLGILSYKFPDKTGLSKSFLHKLVKEMGYDYDVIDLTPTYSGITGKFLDWSEEKHPGLNYILDEVCKLMKIPKVEVEKPIFSNFFLMKADLYKEYGKFLRDCIYLMENNEKLKEMCFQNSKYISSLSSEKLEELTGLNYWTMHTFVLERMINFWVISKKLKVKHLL